MFADSPENEGYVETKISETLINGQIGSIYILYQLTNSDSESEKEDMSEGWID